MTHVSRTSGSILRRRGLFAIVLAAAASLASGQSLTFVSRSGSNTAYCGVVGAGPGATHTFPTPVSTSDTISLSDPGGPTWNSSLASSQLIATATPTSLSIVSAGNSMRSPLTPQLFGGTAATADARDFWTFTLAAAAHFTLNVSL